MNLRKLFSFFSGDLGVDLGTANTLVYARGRGIIVNEPSLVAFNKKTRKVMAVGREAKEMLGRTPRDLEAIEPLKEGVIANFDVTETMLRRFIRQAQRDRKASSPKIVIGVPSGANALDVIGRAIGEVLARVPPELSKDLVDHGLTITGGTGLLRNLDRRLMELTGLPVTVDRNALQSVALGVGRMLEDKNLLERSTYEPIME
jgi:actin-like ATPase involved in cell morphogenesis